MHLPSFYKLKFEKYAFNVKRAAPFGLPAAIFGTFFLTQCCGPSGPSSTTQYTPIFTHQPEEWNAENQRMNDRINKIKNTNNIVQNFNTFPHSLLFFKFINHIHTTSHTIIYKKSIGLK